MAAVILTQTPNFRVCFEPGSQNDPLSGTLTLEKLKTDTVGTPYWHAFYSQWVSRNLINKTNDIYMLILELSREHGKLTQQQ